MTGHARRCSNQQHRRFLLRTQSLEPDRFERRPREVAGHRIGQPATLVIRHIRKCEAEVEIDDLTPATRERSEEVTDHIADLCEPGWGEQAIQTANHPEGRKLDVVAQRRALLTHDLTSGNNRHRPFQLPSTGSISTSTTHTPASDGSLTASLAVVTGIAAAAAAWSTTSDSS